MTAPDTLIRVIAQLQRSPSSAQGRQLLLDYLRKSTGARLCLLFLVEQEQGLLVLLAHSGRRPFGRRPRASSAPRQRPEQPAHRTPSAQQVDTEHIPGNGIFGAALSARGPLYIPTIHGDPRSLQVEQYWARSADRALICAVGQPEKRRGVLVLCFASEPENTEEDARRIQALPQEADFQICQALLPAYLEEDSSVSEQIPGELPSTSGAELSESTTGPATAASAQDMGEDDLRLLTAERARIARDIHDGAAQELAHALHRLDFARRALDKRPEVALRELERAYDTLKNGLEELRDTIAALSSPGLTLEEQDFEIALQALLDEFRRAEPEVTLRYEVEEARSLPPELGTIAFHVIQEALNNVRKHAHASEVNLRIARSDDSLSIEVSDNGRGLRRKEMSNGTRGHFGLGMMRERVQQAQGVLEIESAPGRGTSVRARLPLGVASTLHLTPREREVLHLLSEGATNRRIAQELSLSVETVKSHVHHIIQKMQARDRTQAAVMATRERWL